MRADELTSEWLSDALDAPVAAFHTERIGTGQMSECYRVLLDYDGTVPGPASVVLKVPASDPVSRQTGVALGLYEREVRFYAEVAPRLVGPLAPCYHASFDAEVGTFALLLGDAGPAEVGNEIEGASLERARLAVTELGRLHGSAIADPTLAGAPWLNRESPINQALLAQLYTGFADRYGERLPPQHRMVCERLVASFDAFLAADEQADGPRGLVHGDYRLDNMLFGIEGAARPLTVVDWQTVSWGPAMTDLAYFLGCALPVEMRRAHADELMACYHQALGPTTVTQEDVREGVRRQAFAGVTMTIVSPMLVQRTDRGDEMFMAMIERHCEQVLDNDALAILPEPVAPQPLQPAPADEFAHAAGPEPMWNESWYCDFVAVEHALGGYVRHGLTPNEGTAWFTALLCGPEMPTVAVLDFRAPLDPYALHTDRFDFAQMIVSPLQTYRVVLNGRGEAHDDPAALLRGESGRAVDVSLDLQWSTVGTPYQYRLTSRYEIPCAVSGSVSIEGRRLTIDAAPGQRDHSWGIRDWWGMDWVWSALHLDDGTHLHGVDIRLPGAPPIGVGYIQGAGAVTELDSVGARVAFADNGLPATTALTYNPGALESVADIRGHAPLRLEAPDGRVAWFARSWATVETSDGRGGVGWIEWNRNSL